MTGQQASTEGRFALPRATHERYFEATYLGKTEFYSGIGAGDRVLVREEVTTYNHEGARRAHVGLSIQNLADPGVHLSVYKPDLLADVVEVQ